MGAWLVTRAMESFRREGLEAIGLHVNVDNPGAIELYDRLVAPVAPVTGEAAGLLALIRTLDLDDYVTLIEHLRAEDAGDPTLFDRRWPVEHLRNILGR